MQDDARFEGAYLALVALNWEALERTDGLLAATGNAWATPHIEGRMQWLRLELLQLDACTARRAVAQRLSDAQLQRIRSMVSTLLEWLDFDAATAPDIVRLRLAAAQNWLLDEAGRTGRGDQTPELRRRRG